MREYICSVHNVLLAFSIGSYENVEMDPISDVFSLLKVNSILSARLECAGAWALRFPAYRHMKFGSVHKGSMWVWIEDVTEPVKVEAGDFYLITNGRPYCLADKPEIEPVDAVKALAARRETGSVVRYGEGLMKTVGTGGSFVFDEEMSGLLLDLLPPFIHIRSSSSHARALELALGLIVFETEMPRPGAAIVAGNLANIVLVNILRTHLGGDSCLIGWLGALADAQIRRALERMHGETARRWKVKELASEVGMSRTSFSERFKALVGVPPMEYLIRWRMTIARNALRHGKESLSDIAASVGYASETSFSLAFKGIFGKSPGRYRTSVAKQQVDNI
jgi:AraC-like DNA-binding protein